MWAVRKPGRCGWLVLALLAGCERDMEDQPRLEPYEAAPIFPHAQSARLPVEGTVPQEASAVATPPQPPVTLDLLQRGRERYDIYCSPCHGRTGDGGGMIVQRGFPHPPSFHDQAVHAVPDSFIYQVISQGFGRMYAYANRVLPEDRWAIAAYIRALQLSQQASAQDVRDAGLESQMGGPP
jgi:mono/diheme cytochrome c family protein